MPFRITPLPSSDKLCHCLSWPLLQHYYPREHVEGLVARFHPHPTRARKLTLVLVIYVLICWTLFLRHSLGAVFARLARAEHWLAEQEREPLPSRSAWTYRRHQVGVRPLRKLFEQCCRPLALPHTKGAFAFGFHL